MKPSKYDFDSVSPVSAMRIPRLPDWPLIWFAIGIMVLFVTLKIYDREHYPHIYDTLVNITAVYAVILFGYFMWHMHWMSKAERSYLKAVDNVMAARSFLLHGTVSDAVKTHEDAIEAIRVAQTFVPKDKLH